MTFDPMKAVHTPPEVARYALDAIEKTMENKRNALSIGIPKIEDYFAPMLPGQLGVILAQTSNYKSGFMHMIERLAAQQLMDSGRINEAIIHVSVEEVVEEQAYLMMARETGETAGRLARGEVQDWDGLRHAASNMGSVPIYRIGESLARAEDFPLLTMTNMIKSIDAITKGKVTGQPVKPAGLFFDYLQAFPIDSEVSKEAGAQQRRLQVRNDIYKLRQAAAYFNCPVWVAVQAKQTLSIGNSQIHIPNVYDGEESSSIAQRADRIISLWLPKQTHPVGTTISHGGVEFVVDENLMFVKVAKQRGGLPAGKTWMCNVDYSKNMIYPV